MAHFGIYEVALTQGEDATDAFAELEARIRRLVAELPKFEPPAELIAPAWSRMAHPTGRAMDWTHHLHSQLYDILTDPSVTEKQAAAERATAYYLSNAEAAFSTRGYGHRWMMGGGTWAGTFPRKYPGINGILWAYHWHHAAVYEALMEPTPGAQARELDRVIDLFVDSVLVTPGSGGWWEYWSTRIRGSASKFASLSADGGSREVRSAWSRRSRAQQTRAHRWHWKPRLRFMASSGASAVPKRRNVRGSAPTCGPCPW